MLGKILFVLYIVFLVYFLCFSEWYGRTGTVEEYRYNLVLFKEISRFIEYREELNICGICQFIRKYIDLCAIRIFYIRGEPQQRLFENGILQFCTLLRGGDIPAFYKSRKL